jgi:UDP-N-acetylmuramoyl-L-alanyl-D-glutamate--2,6-diaminopimelate ligase
MRLSELMMPFKAAISQGDMNVEVTGLAEDSRRVEPGMLFIAVKGTKSDGHQYLEEAAAAGAVGLVVESGRASDKFPPGLQIPVIEVPDSRRFLGVLASRFFGYPAARLKMIGVTGTNGKTTTTYLCKAILESAGKLTGLIGTVSYIIGNEELSASHTTPGALELQALLKKMADAGLDAVIMEVSSHALALDRTAGCAFDGAVFTNLTQDHLDFHTDMEDYFQAKLRLFTQRGANGRAIVNADDPYGERVAVAFPQAVWRYSIERAADIYAEDVRISLEGVEFVVRTPFGSAKICSPLVGRHNVYNILGAIGAGLQQGVSLSDIAHGVRRLVNVPGRFERVEMGQPFTVIVDYAHTEDALYRLLSTTQAVKTGRIITVFGCGGDRDRSKRPKMGRVAGIYSDIVVVTSDNPRTEDPRSIIEEIEPGVRTGLKEAGRGRYVICPDRREAIETAIREARPGDLVLIAGKGHENYQVIGTTKHSFDDRVVAREALQGLKS